MDRLVKQPGPDTPTLDVRIASNGVMVLPGPNQFRGTLIESCVFNRPEEFGAWAEHWMRRLLSEPQPKQDER